MISRRSSGGDGGIVSKLGLDLTCALACVPGSLLLLLVVDTISVESQHRMSIWFSSVGTPEPKSLARMIPISCLEAKDGCGSVKPV